MITPKEPDGVQLGRTKAPFRVPGQLEPGPEAKKRLRAATKELALAHSPDAMKELIAISKMWRTAVKNVGTEKEPMFEVDAKIIAVSRQAATDILAYGIGRPAVSIEANDTGATMLQQLADALMEKP